MRKNLLKTIIKDYEGEVWCISKHLLSASMRLMEVGTKAQSMHKPTEAYEYFDKAYDLYALFWGLQMNVIGSETIKDIPVEEEIGEQVTKIVADKIDDGKEKSTTDDTVTPIRKGFMGKLGLLVRKAVDCCIE
jgi:hypothetical protein